ncbi:glycosyltransferase [Chelatococcus sp. GCM10030263]|uniref:glycosyltransferase n=1 Tax=Chelatococcus sp. GCM10030263 TaxID=3273387 RepID=UPI00360A8E9E
MGTTPFQGAHIRYLRYAPPAVQPSRDMIVNEASARLRRAATVAAQARLLKRDGFEPDVMLVHSGWGEALYLKDIFPRAKLVCYCEFYYRRRGADVGFDPEFPVSSLDVLHRLRMRNAFELASLEEAVAGISPTEWQRYTYPQEFHGKITVQHEGVDLDAIADVPQTAEGAWRETLGIGPATPVVSYVARYLEPYRGFHTFMRSLPSLQERLPEAHVVVVGSEKGGYGRSPGIDRSWKDVLLEEVGGALDQTRIHFLGKLTYRDYVAVSRLSNLHVYLTYPFVLSWSAIEAMAMGRAMVASNTPPVREFMTDGETARLVDFFDPQGLATTAAELLGNPAERQRLGENARALIAERRLDRRDASERLYQFIRQL